LREWRIARLSAAGLQPEYADLDWSGLNFEKDRFAQILHVDRALWNQECQVLDELFQKVGTKCPTADDEHRRFDAQFNKEKVGSSCFTEFGTPNLVTRSWEANYHPAAWGLSKNGNSGKPGRFKLRRVRTDVVAVCLQPSEFRDTVGSNCQEFDKSRAQVARESIIELTCVKECSRRRDTLLMRCLWIKRDDRNPRKTRKPT
jgi:phosphoenolpyruvate carboxykinase-like protein